MQTSELGPALARAIRTPARRRFSAEPVASELVAEIVEAARWTGSARNRQPWRFVELRSRAVIEQIAGLGAYAQFVASAPVALVVASGDHDEPIDPRRFVGRVGVAARVHERINLPGDTVQITLQGLRRITVDDIEQSNPYPIAVCRPARETPPACSGNEPPTPSASENA